MLTISGTLEDLMRDLPALVATGVEVRVEVEKKQPFWNGKSICWFAGGQSEDEGEVPSELLGNEFGDIGFRTCDEARQALSDGILAWARAVRKQEVQG